MRGSPLIRFIILALALMATGAGLWRVTAARNGSDTRTAPVTPHDQPQLAEKPVPFRLLLSAPAAAVTIDTGRQVRPPMDAFPISGVLMLDPKNPRIGLVVRWKNVAAADEHRFAKLTLEAPGQDTFTHVFDAVGDIDDLLELPLPAADD